MKQLRGANSTGVFANCLDVLAINIFVGCVKIASTLIFIYKVQ